jgi:SAM-dependent methyltransferase
MAAISVRYRVVAGPHRARDYTRSPVRWVAKAGVQWGLGFLPRQGEPVNYFFQRRVARSLPAGEGVFRKKFARALQHQRIYEEQRGDGPAPADACHYEFGTGWDLSIPLCLAALGMGRQVLVDIRPSVRAELVNDSLRTFERLRGELEQEAGRPLRPLGPPTVASTAELEQRFGIRYLAPCDARATGLEAGSVDLISSTDVCEHVPEPDLLEIFRECRRLLRPGGVVSCRVDLQDHYAYFDRSLSRYNFLRFSDRTWSLVNSPLQYQNRLRVSDYLRLVSDAGLELVSSTPSLPKDTEQQLARVPLAPRFASGYTRDELGVTVLSFVARRASA